MKTLLQTASRVFRVESPSTASRLIHHQQQKEQSAKNPLEHLEHVHRSLFYVPADSEKKLSKIMTSHADTCIVEMEDGVAVNQKAAARQGMKRFFAEQADVVDPVKYSGKVVAVRVNAPQTEFFEDDMEACLSVGDRLRTVLIPKVSSLTDVKIIMKKLQALGAPSRRSTPLGVITYAESAEGIVSLDRICEALKSKNDLLRLEAVVFGSDDYCADVGAQRSPSGLEVLYARQRVVAVARAFGIQPIDMVHIDIKNLEGLKSQSEQGFSFGFSGKQCIHPIQLDIVNAAFSPSAERFEWAQQLIAEFEAHQERGSGAFVFRGQMIDMPLLRLARRLVSFKKQVEVDK